METQDTIYVITNKKNGKQYVGKTSKTADSRFEEHLATSRRSHCSSWPLYRAINKYGDENFEVSILEYCQRDASSEREMHWIKKLCTYGRTGYNATIGGEGRPVLDYEKVISVLSGEGRFHPTLTARIINCDRSSVIKIAKIYHFPYDRRNLDALTGVKYGSKPVIQIDKNTDIVIQYFSSCAEAQRATGAVHISECAKGTRGTSGGFKWAYA